MKINYMMGILVISLKGRNCRFWSHLECSGACFLKVPIINGPVKLLLFTCKIEVSILLHLT